MFCLPFANRASVSGGLYRFRPKSSHLSSGILGLPSWCFVHHLSFWSTHMHCISHLTYHAMYCIMLLVHFPWLIVGPLLVFFLWVEPGDENAYEEPVENAYEDQAFDNSENFAGKMTVPSKSLLSLLASCPLYRYVALPTTCYIMTPILPCQASNPPFLANRCLAMLPLLLSPSYSVASCRWRWSLFHVGTWILLGYHYYLLFTLMHLYTW